MRIAFVSNHDWFFISHRLPIALEALRQGHEVYFLGLDTGGSQILRQHGIKFVEIPLNPAGKNPLQELYTMLVLWKQYRKIKPDIIHHITLKATLLGSLAAKLAGIHRVVNAIAGFGSMYSGGHALLRKAIALEMHLAYKSKNFHFILQNPEDYAQVGAEHFVPDSHLHLIKGSGVDLDEWSYQPKEPSDLFTLLFPARMLRDKGVFVAVEAMNKLKDRLQGKARLVLAGGYLGTNPSLIPIEELQAMQVPGYIDWISHQDDMIPHFVSCDVAVLPSIYREGLPKALIEACAIGRPIITTDVPGCRMCIKDKWNGLMVPPRDADALAEAILWMYEHRDKLMAMGKHSRELAERDFSIKSVIEKHFAIYSELLGRSVYNDTRPSEN